MPTPQRGRSDPSPLNGDVKLACFASVAPGLESLAIAEATSLGIPATAEQGGFAFEGDSHMLFRANAALRIPSRIIVRLSSFEARSFAELQRHAKKVDWGRVVKPGDAVRFRVTCRKSKLYHSDAVAQRLADALMRGVPGAHAEQSSVADDEGAEDEGESSDVRAADDSTLIVVRVLRDRVTVSADSSGVLLHRRGWRQATAKAPLRETIAAAMIQASGWDGRVPLVDPLCGSGTIPIEAALRALHIAPGLHRGFAMERWPSVAPAVGDAERAELARLVLDETVAIVGSDRDAGAIVSARANAVRAGVEQRVSFLERALSSAEFPEGLGVVVTNPPYGIRVGRETQVRDLWARLGQVLRARASGWTVTLLSPGAELESQLGIPLTVVATTSNGGIPVRIVRGVVP